MDHERLSALDTAFLCLESQEAPMHLGALAVFQPHQPIEPSHLLDVVADRVERLPSLRQRVRPAWLPPGAAVWAEDGLFHLPSHLQLHRLTEGDQHTLATLAGELMAEPLDLDRPLWQIHLVTGLAGGRFAVLVKLHHALADGLRAVELGIGLLDGYTDLVAAQASATDGADAGSWLPSLPSSSASSSLSSWSSSLPSLTGAVKAAAGLALRPDRLIAGVARTAVGLPGDLLRAAANMPGDVVRTATSLPGAVRHAADAVGIASSILASARLGAFLPPIIGSSPGRTAFVVPQPGGLIRAEVLAVASAADDPASAHSPLTDQVPAGPLPAGPLPADQVPADSRMLDRAGSSAGSPPARVAAVGSSAADRRLALLRLDVADVRQIRKRHGGTDNDVLLAVIAGALHDWLTGRGRCGEGINVRALIPVSRRSRPNDPRRGNMLSGYLCDLPVHERDPLARLHTIRTTMDRNKAAGFARGPGAIPVLADRLPAAVHRVTGPITRRSAPLLFDTMITNVPIPARPLSLAGAPLQELYPIAPLARGQALGVALSAYRGTVHVGLHADRRVLPDLHRLADAVPGALASLGDAAPDGPDPTRRRPRPRAAITGAPATP